MVSTSQLLSQPAISLCFNLYVSAEDLQLKAPLSAKPIQISQPNCVDLAAVWICAVRRLVLIKKKNVWDKQDDRFVFITFLTVIVHLSSLRASNY